MHELQESTCILSLGRAINRALKLPDEIICAMAAIRIPGSRTCDFVETVQDQEVGGEGASKIAGRERKGIAIGVIRTLMRGNFR